MLKLLQKASWTVALRGLVAVAFGIMLFAWPDISLLNVLKVFAIYAFAEGAVVVFGSLWNRDEHSDWPTLSLIGLFSMAVGVFIFARPDLTELAFLYLVAARALVIGVLDVGVATQVRREVKNEWMIAASGLVSIVFGVLVFGRPTEGVIEVLWLISLYAVIHGAFWMAYAFGSRGYRAAEPAHTRTLEE